MYFECQVRDKVIYVTTARYGIWINMQPQHACDSYKLLIFEPSLAITIAAKLLCLSFVLLNTKLH